MTAKKMDAKNRFRSKTIGFRASPEEWSLIETEIKFSGLSKQDYIMKCLANKKIVVTPNIRIYKMLKDEHERVLMELKKINQGENEKLNSELFEVIMLMSNTLNSMKGGGIK